MKWRVTQFLKREEVTKTRAEVVSELMSKVKFGNVLIFDMAQARDMTERELIEGIPFGAVASSSLIIFLHPHHVFVYKNRVGPDGRINCA